MNDGAPAAPKTDAASLTIDDLLAQSEPFELLSAWLAEAAASEPNDPTAMALATVDAAGMPDVRMVLLKGIDQAGLTFYTNLESRKGEQLAAAPRAALCFHWKSLRRQVRARGPVFPVDPAEADAYFASRPRLSRIGAWASRQSRPVETRFALQKAVARHTARFAAGEIPRPPHWSGFRLKPMEMEFWRDGAFRLHDRVRFSADGRGGWTKAVLYP
jgi:pyridoxamine 5'-phosphate oxidase